MTEMPKTYDHLSVEQRWYKIWEEAGYFHAEPNPEKEPFTIVIPPPNITGKLHMGHALDNSLQDTIIRYKRMAGYETLWLPGTDHASIATEVKIVQALAKEGIDKRELGREGFLKRAWEWRNEYGGTIVKQLRKMGSSCDWARERFTMDEGCNKAVVRVFKSLYDKGLIYKGDRIINWCPCCKTALSDAEVEYETQASHLWHIRYDAPDKSYSIEVATTRPETMLGDTAIAVHPDDERYKAIVGKTVVIPGVGREIPIVTDSYCEMDFGTGAVKITPGHDPNDFEVGRRANLPVLRVFDDEGKINELGGKYCGQDRFECRKNLVEELKTLGNLVEIEDYSHNVGTCYRCHTTIESIVSKQWFVDMKPVTEPALEAVRNGSIRFVPERYSKSYYNWMENIRDWCISRQLWWGHRIPVYYCDDCGGVFCEETPLTRCPKCGAPVRQDEDVLDTWFSSGLWPFSTLGWPENTEELKYFYPTSTLVTGYDIITFWVSRMITAGMEVMHEPPFKTVYVHGLVRDSLGRKMSKSLNNGIDPLDVIENYGADSLRFSLITGNSAGNDMRFYDEKVKAARNFCNKIYNAARFVRMNLPEEGIPEINEALLDIGDKWILSRLNTVIGEVTANLDSYELNIAAEKIYDFIWSEFCDWYIEISKPSLYSDDPEKKGNVCAVLVKVLTDAMKLLHPFMPFITEELYQQLPGHEETIMLSAWPKAAGPDYKEEATLMGTLMELTTSVRNIRAEYKVPVNQRPELRIIVKDPAAFAGTEAFLNRLAGAGTVTYTAEAGQVNSSDVHIACNGAEVYIPIGELVDIEKELERLDKEIARCEAEIARLSGKLSNEKFLAKAPAQVVETEKGKLSAAEELLNKNRARKEALSAAD